MDGRGHGATQLIDGVLGWCWCSLVWLGGVVVGLLGQLFGWAVEAMPFFCNSRILFYVRIGSYRLTL